MLSYSDRKSRPLLFPTLAPPVTLLYQVITRCLFQQGESQNVTGQRTFTILEIKLNGWIATLDKSVCLMTCNVNISMLGLLLKPQNTFKRRYMFHFLIDGIPQITICIIRDKDHVLLSF